ncbi:hypothetical protein KSP39_PZI012210 [Platanthera zijinensis]|uniref:Uncharacterized protein n=1 Tax=Platanthera zijinensis TaxID=2320716 RepID=A0AAP0G4T5_9ASPA
MPTPLFFSDEVSCVGWDGWPLRRGGGEDGEPGRVEKEEINGMEDNRRYYEKHKPSPLSEVDLADTRKPISQATDRPRDDKVEYLLVRETLDDALRRAEELWWASKVRGGDPDSPQAKALTGMLGRKNKEPEFVRIIFWPSFLCPQY